MNSKFIVIEGLEGSGKTSISTQVADILRSYGVSDLVFTREPGGTPLAEALRTLIKKGVDNEPVNHCAELLMLYAARAQLIESVIKPAFTRGAWVIADRHDLSSQAYQGGGRGIDRNLLTILRNVVLGDFYPDLTLYLDVPPTVGLAHAKARGKLDRIEMESLEFFDRVRTSYRTLAEEDDRIITIDASQPQSMVNAEIHNQLTKWLCEQLTSS